MKIFVSLVILGLITGCLSTRPPELEIINFDSSAWKKDSLGCEKQRQLYMQSLRNQSSLLIGATMESILQLLGPPNCRNLGSSTYEYFVGPSTLCGKNKRGDCATIEVNKFIVMFVDGKVSEAVNHVE